LISAVLITVVTFLNVEIVIRVAARVTVNHLALDERGVQLRLALGHPGAYIIHEVRTFPTRPPADRRASRRDRPA